MSPVLGEAKHTNSQAITLKVCWQEQAWSVNPSYTVYEFECLGRPIPKKNPARWFLESVSPSALLPKQMVVFKHRAMLRSIIRQLLELETKLPVAAITLQQMPLDAGS